MPIKIISHFSNKLIRIVTIQTLDMAMINDEMNGDVFSWLPDSVISLILSFLPFIDAARTSVLSKRWSSLWRTTGRIEFDESFFAERRVTRRGFIDFMRRWMLNFKGPAVDSFSLSLSNPGENRLDVENCLNFAVLQGTRCLYLDFSDPSWRVDEFDPHLRLFGLPTFVYRHKMLESLKLFSCRFDVSEFKDFSTLKDLSLGWVEVGSPSLKALLMNCPHLESLCLKNCRNLGDPEISGTDLKLRRLIIDKCCIDYEITLMAKKLKYFRYSGLLKRFLLEHQPEVEEVELDFGLETEFDNSGYSGDTLQDILRNLYPSTLTVCSYILQEIPAAEEPLCLYPYLEDLRHLILKTSMHSYEQYGISFMLNSCPGLEMLTIDLVPARILNDYDQPFDERQSHVFWARYMPFISCVRETLKVVQVQGFRGEPNEVQLLQNMLRFGCVLERLRIDVLKTVDSELTQWKAQMLQYSAKSSRALQVVIS